MSETVRETIKRVYDEACNYYQLFEGESDRGAAVLAHAFFEHRLGETIKSHDEKAFNKDLRFWVNIRIAYSLGLFDQETLAALDDINKIRNKFAHLPEPLNIQTRAHSGFVFQAHTQGRPDSRRLSRTVSQLLAGS